MSTFTIRRPALLPLAIALSVAASIVLAPNSGRATTADPTVAVIGPGARLLPNGLYEVTLADGHRLQTHGGDSHDTMHDHGLDMAPGDPERTPACATDYYQHVLYGRPAGQPDRFEAVVETIRSAIRRMNAVLNESAILSGNYSADFKVRCDAGGEIAVGRFSAEASDFSAITNAARAAGFDEPNADYSIFWDGTYAGVCGLGSIWRDDSPGEGNRNNDGGGYAVTYNNGCWTGRTPMHENGHNQGAVQRDAPNSTGYGYHCNERFDVMCGVPDDGDRNQTPVLACVDRMHYDCGYDTYFDVAPEPGEWLETHWNIGSTVNRFITFGAPHTKPAASASPSAIDFGSRTTHSRSTPTSVTLASRGDADLTVGAATISGPNAGEFAITGDGCAGRTLPPGGICQLTVEFRPLTAGAKTATLEIPHNAANARSTTALSGMATALPSGASVSPSSLAFESTTAGTSSVPQTVTVSSTADGPLTVDAATITGPDAADFTITSDGCVGRTLPRDSTCTVEVAFTPASAGAKSAALAIPHDAATSPSTVTLSGTGIAPTPAASVAPSSIAFGSQTAGTSGAPRTVTLSSTGTGSLAVGTATITGANPAEFTIASDACSGRTVAPGSACSLTVAFVPSTGGSKAATLTIPHDAAESPGTVTLTGTGVEPVPGISATPSSLAFGSRTTGTVSPVQRTTLRNTGTGPLIVGSVTPTGTGAAQFEIRGDTCSASTLAPGATCAIDVVFAPVTAGSFTAAISIPTNASATPHTIGLSGTGVAPAPAIALSPASVVFGNVQIGTTATKTITVTNTGTATLTVSSAMLAGSQAYAIASETCTAASVAVNDTCRITLTFAPATTGSFGGTVTLTSNAPGSPHAVPITGTGAPAITFSPESLNFGFVESGTHSGERTVTLTNNSATVPLRIDSVEITGASAAAFTISTPGCTGIVPAGGSCGVGIRFGPETTGAAAATLRFDANPAIGYALAGAGIDSAPPQSTFTTEEDSILFVNRGISLLTDDKVAGSSTDAGTAITKVVVTFFNTQTLEPTIRTPTGSQLSCTVPRSCTWQARVPNTPGIYRVNVRATDGAGHTETPGPQISVYVV